MPDRRSELGIEGGPQAGQDDTPTGFLMAMLRRVAKHPDHVAWSGWRLEVMDVDPYRVDQVMIARQAPVAALVGAHEST